MEFEGTVVSVLPVVKGTSARGEWMKQEVIFDQPGEFNRKVCVGFWGDKAQEAGTLRPGEVVAVSANVESREYNGRWYTEVRAWRMTRKAAGETAPGPGALPPLDAFAPGRARRVERGGRLARSDPANGFRPGNRRQQTERKAPSQTDTNASRRDPKGRQKSLTALFIYTGSPVHRSRFTYTGFPAYTEAPAERLQESRPHLLSRRHF